MIPFYRAVSEVSYGYAGTRGCIRRAFNDEYSEALRKNMTMCYGFASKFSVDTKVLLERVAKQVTGLQISQKPADKDHSYGHWKAETVSSLVASFIMAIVGLQVLYEAVTSILEQKTEAPDLITAWTGIFCAIVMYFVYHYNRNLATKINSQSVMASAKDNLSDAWVSIGTAIGIIRAQFHLPWLDSVTALIVGFLICKTAWDIFREASHHLTDGFNENQLEEYKETILNMPGVKGVKDIKARNYGSSPVVDVSILVNFTLGVGAAHDITTKVESALAQEHNVVDANVHVEPS